MSCGVLRTVVNTETGEEFTLLQLEVTNPYFVWLKGEDGQVIKSPVDLLVCSTCKSIIYALGLDVFLCEKELRKIYERTGEASNVLFDGSGSSIASRLINNSLDGGRHNSI